MAKRLNDYYLHSEDDYEQQEIKSVAHAEDDLIRIREKSEPRGARVWSFLRPVVIWCVSLFVAGGLVYYAINYVRSHYLDPVDLSDKSQQAFVVKKGSSLSSISEMLEEQGIIRNKQVFKLYVDFSDNASKLKAGTYMLSPSMSFDDIIYTLRKGMSTDPTGKVTLLEGLSASAFAPELVKNGFLQDEEAYLKMAETGEGANITSSELKEIVKNNETAAEKRKYALEGYLFPDTYEFYKDTDAATVINKQLSRFFEVLTSDDYTRAMDLGMSIDEVVIMASIIEKEAQPHDFAKVSAVLHNRLERDMPLACDSTAAYALGIKNRLVLTDGELGITRDEEGKEVVSETPASSQTAAYNTHVRKGLPIGPICNPSKAAIKAALHPDEEYIDEGYLFFVTKDPTPDAEGKTYLEFNKDANAHYEAVSQYKPLWEAYDRKQAAEEQ